MTLLSCHFDDLNFVHTEELGKNIKYILFVYPVRNEEVKMTIYLLSMFETSPGVAAQTLELKTPLMV